MDTARCLLVECHSGWSQEKTPFAEENTYITVSGVVKDKQNRKDFRVCQCISSGQKCGDGDKCGW